MTKLRIGNSMRGFDTVEFGIDGDGNRFYNFYGNKTLLKKALAAYRRGEQSVVTAAGDELPIKIN